MVQRSCVMLIGVLTVGIGAWVAHLYIEEQQEPTPSVSASLVAPLHFSASLPPRASNSPAVAPLHPQALRGLSAKLLGTMLEDEARVEPAKAFIMDTLDRDRPSVVSLAVGDSLQGRFLTQIERGVVKLRQPNGTEEQLALEEVPANMAIHQVGPDDYQVDRQLMTRLLHGDINTLRSQVRLHPSVRRFQLAGFRLARVEPASLVEQAGFQMDDVVTAVGDHRLNSIAATLSAYQEARESSEVAIQVTRGGRQKTLHYYLN